MMTINDDKKGIEVHLPNTILTCNKNMHSDIVNFEMMISYDDIESNIKVMKVFVCCGFSFQGPPCPDKKHDLDWNGHFL